MVSVFDVAKYILGKTGEISTMKLQKLVYYSQAWHMVWHEEPLFIEKIEAWANGPVVAELYGRYKGRFKISSSKKGSIRRLAEEHKTTINKVINFYGGKDGHYLSELVHTERPWKAARGCTPVGEHSSAEITPLALLDYYGGLK